MPCSFFSKNPTSLQRVKAGRFPTGLQHALFSAYQTRMCGPCFHLPETHRLEISEVGVGECIRMPSIFQNASQRGSAAVGPTVLLDKNGNPSSKFAWRAQQPLSGRATRPVPYIDR
jgi:hypothetical protein